MCGRDGESYHSQASMAVSADLDLEYMQVLSVHEALHLSSYLRSPDAYRSIDATTLIFVEL